MKAKRATIAIGTMEIDVFQLPDGSYRMSQTQVAETIGQSERNAREFLQSKRAKSLPGKDYTSAKNDELEVEKSHAGRGATRIVPWPLGITAIYWYFQAKRGNKDAETLVISCLYDSLLRRADEVFDVTRTQDEYHAANVELMQALGRVARERDILLENYDIDDDARQLADAAWSEVTRLETENERLREQLRYYQ